jgi:Lysosomal transcription factor, NCU-G1
LQIDELLTPKVKQGEPGGFMEWRPVAYTSPEMNIEASTSTVHYAMKNVSQAYLKGSLLRDFYGHKLTHQLVPQAINVSFGISEDGFYNAAHFNAW